MRGKSIEIISHDLFDVEKLILVFSIFRPTQHTLRTRC